jgi:hypothetical protein
MTTDPSAANDADPRRLECRRCGRDLHPGRGELYVVSIVGVADPWPPVFTEEDLALDVGDEIRRLIAQARGLDARQAREQVYRRVILHLCISCYQDWIEDPAGS